ncbi:MAG: hypothetical protein HY698_11575 [Deltaproteobacteria bacterium]|nr:hypothetical protein [Deltaproteobacteria bacterium]
MKTMLAQSVRLTVLVALAGACTEVGESDLRPDHPRPHGIYIPIEAPAGTKKLRLGPPKRRLLFVNRNGGTYRAGNDDAGANT